MEINIEKMRQEIAALEPETERLWSEFQAIEKGPYLQARNVWFEAHTRRENIRRVLAFALEEAKKGTV